MKIKLKKLSKFKFNPTTTEAYTNKPAMLLDDENYAVPSDDGSGYLLCVGKPEGEDSETVDSYPTWDALASWWNHYAIQTKRRDKTAAT